MSLIFFMLLSNIKEISRSRDHKHSVAFNFFKETPALLLFICEFFRTGFYTQYLRVTVSKKYLSGVKSFLFQLVNHFSDAFRGL